MAATLPSIPSHLFSSFALWRQPAHNAPLTPPMTSVFQERKTEPTLQVTTLPPISHLDRHLPPLTPPRLEVSSYQYSSPASPMLPTPGPPNPYPLPPAPQVASDVFQGNPGLPPDAYPVVDWLDFSRKRSAHFIAEKTCEMLCYLWFASPSSSSPLEPNLLPYSNHCNSTNSLQLHATPTFVYFMQKLLETTQVSQSVIVLSLHYIYRLKERNRFTTGQAGSEFRIAVAGLMMANKFLDDNTYTNQTWSEVSGINLDEINRMEREFLVGIDFGLFVDKQTYESWLNLLKGLVWAKEMDSRRWRRSRSHGFARVPRLPHPQNPAHSARRNSTRYQTSYRARSTSPAFSKLSTPPYNSNPYPTPANTDNVSPTLRLGSKRSAAAAFSPTSATFTQLPAKRPVSMSLVIPEYVPGNGPSSNNSHSPLEPLQSFAKLSIGSSPGIASSSQLAPSAVFVPSTNQDNVPTTLVTAYSVDERRQTVPPQNLYFYSLAGSPMENEEESRWRKAKLRYHQPPPPTTAYYPPRPTIPIVQSASTSPHEIHMNVPHTLPHLHDAAWSQQQNGNEVPASNGYSSPPQPQPQQDLPHCMKCSVTSAPFANAGPPGVQFYSTAPAQRAPAVYSHNFSRGRPFY